MPPRPDTIVTLVGRILDNQEERFDSLETKLDDVIKIHGARLSSLEHSRERVRGGWALIKRAALVAATCTTIMLAISRAAQ